MMLEGGCLCGQVRYRVAGEPLNVRACHCRNCQKLAGGPFYARAIFRDEGMQRLGETERYRSSHRLFRLTCSSCHCLVFTEPVDVPGLIAISLASLDDPGALIPECHIWTDSMVSWLKLDDGLPRFPGPHPSQPNARA
jgi:hypothetical protein